MTPGSGLPALNAVLNAASAVLLVTGYVFIKRRRIAAHRACMLGAFALSIIFLISYVVYHARVGSVPFTRTGWIRPVYFSILITHVILAATVPPLAIVTIARAWRDRIDAHKRLARVTLPIWLYVSVTGVIVYWMLYRL